MAYLFCFISSLPLLAQNDLNVSQQKAYTQIVKLNFDSANLLLTHKEEPADLYLRHLLWTIDFLLTENPNTLEIINMHQDKYLERIERLAVDPWKDFFLAEIKLRAAFIDAKLGNELSATWQLRQSYKLIIQNQEKYPGFEANYKTLGLLHVLLGAVPDQYQWIINLLGMEGDVQNGLHELNKVHDIFSIEASAMKSVINAYLLNNTEIASEHIQNLLRHNQDNRLLAYIAVAVMLKNSEARQAEKLLLKYANDSNPLLYYQGGELCLQLGEYELAESYLLKFLSLFKGNNFIKDAYYKLFLTAWVQGKKEKAEQYHQKALEVGQTLSEADKHASKMLKQGFKLNPTIMSIRLFTDGGEYSQAEALIGKTDTASFVNPTEKLEFLYRKARLQHKLNNIEQAKKMYIKVIHQQTGHEYFAPNSCLQLGYIYQNEFEMQEAKKWFEKALSYPKHEYKSSIDNKAKAALKSL